MDENKIPVPAKILLSASIFLFVFILLENWFGIFIKEPITFWWVIAIDFLLLFFGLGLLSHNRLDGALIDTRNRITLSRLQIGLWTILIFSSLLAIGYTRAFAKNKIGKEVDINYYYEMQTKDTVEETQNADICFPDAKDLIEKTKDETEVSELKINVTDECINRFSINLPGNLIAVLGISLASLSGSLIIKESKKGKKPDLIKYEEQVSLYEKKIKEKNREISDIGEENDLLEKEKKDNSKILKTEDEEKKRVAVLNRRIKANNRKKEEKSADVDELKKEFKKAETQFDEAKNNAAQGDGLLYNRPTAKKASWSDIVMKEEIENFQTIDIGKVQMLIITIVVLFSYASTLYYSIFLSKSTLWDPFGLSFPDFPSSILTLIAVSHTGYLALKATDQTPTK